MKKTNSFRCILLILTACLLTAVLQASSIFSAMSHFHKILIVVFFYVIYAVYLIFITLKKKWDEEHIVLALTMIGLILRCTYVLFSGVYDRQHDAGAYTGIADKQINPGHLGYIEYIYKFHMLPQIHPYELFGYYHPPLHHIIGALWVTLNTALHVPEAAAFENLQVLTLFYSALCIPLTYRILKYFQFHSNGLYLALSLIVFHPTFIFMSGSINNDMLSTLLLFLCIYVTLLWIREKSLKHILWIALALGFGMICKLNIGLLSFPIGLLFLIHLIQLLLKGKKQDLFLCLRNYGLFLLVCAPIGLSFIVRNLIRFHVMPGIPTPSTDSVMYYGNYSFWERMGIPTSLAIDYPFHTINASQTSNTWIILFKTAIYAEIRPGDLSSVLFFLCQTAYLLSVILGVVLGVITLYLEIQNFRKKKDMPSLFLFSGFLLYMAAFFAFTVEYPFTCSSDFRYLVISLLYTAIGIGRYNLLALIGRRSKLFRTILNASLYFLLALLTFIYLVWNQW